MKKLFMAVLGLFICIQLAGCSPWVVRTSEENKPRVDQEISGNRGFLFGKPSSAPKEPVFKERKTYRMEVEIPQWKKGKTAVKKVPQEEAERKGPASEGNKGYIFKSEGIDTEKAEPLAPAPVVKAERKKTRETTTYKVREGDTLQKISAKFYGTTKKWILLYEANKDKLKSPDRLYPGEVLIIPEAGPFQK